MNEIIMMVVSDLEKVGIGAVIFLMTYVSNIILGSYKNVKIEGYEFDWKLILNSIVKYIVVGFGIAFLSIVASILPVYVEYIGMEIEPSTIETISSSVIVGSFIAAAVRYATDAFSKIKSIFGI